MSRHKVNLLYYFLLIAFYFFYVNPIIAESPDLAGYWNLNDNLLDFSGNDCDGTVVIGTENWAAGKVGKAFSFDGNTAVRCGSNSNLSIADNISIELWMYPKQWVTGNQANPVSKWTSTSDANYSMYFYGDTAGTYYKKIAFWANAGGTWQCVSPLYLIPALDTWYHIVWTYNSTSGGKLYINGSLFGSTYGAGKLAVSTANFYIGLSNGRGFNGLIDEVKVYNKVLTSEEVQEKYQNVHTTAYWNLHGNIFDFSGNGNNGTVYYGTENWGTGKVGKAFSFNGSTSINCGNNSSLSIADNISIELWMNPQQWVSGYQANPVSKWTNTSDANYSMYFYGDTAGTYYKKIAFWANAGGTWQCVSPLYLIPALDTWYHIVWTYNSTSGGKLYINGTLHGSSSGAGTLTVNNANFYIGKSGGMGFNGLIDEVKVYDKVLSSTEVAANYQDQGVSGAVLENTTLKLTVNSAGKITELARKRAGGDVEYSGGTVDFARIKKAGVWYSSSSCIQKEGRWIIDFGNINLAMELSIKEMDYYYVFQVYAVYGDTEDVEELQILNIAPPSSVRTRVDNMSGLLGNDISTLILRGMNARSNVSSGVFPGIVDASNGLELAKFGLLGYYPSAIRTSLQNMLTAEGLPRTSLGGAWALDAADAKTSYMFVFDLTTSNVNSYINTAQEGKIDIINVYSWWDTLGHYGLKSSLYPNGLNDLKACVDAIHAAGLKASLHCMTGLISTNDAGSQTPRTDSYVSLGDSRLFKDELFTLTSSISAASTTISVDAQPSAASGWLQIGNEIIKYEGHTTTSPYQFTNCTRGAYGTTAQTHSTGTSIGHLVKAYDCFLPDPNSTLVDDIAYNISNVINFCGFDMIYLDGAEGFGTPYGSAKMGMAIFNRIKKDVRVEASYPLHNYWTFYSNTGAWDHQYYGTKDFIDWHVTCTKQLPDSRLTPIQLGWWCFLGFNDDYYSQLPDEVEYLCCKTLAIDAAISFIGLDFYNPENARQGEYLEIINAYETLRRSGNVPQAVKDQLKTVGNEFHLNSANSIIQRDIVKNKVTSLGNGSNVWTVNNRFSSQSAKFRIRTLHSTVTNSYDIGPNISLLDCSGTETFAFANAPDVTSSFTVSNGIATYAAINNGTTSTGAWAKVSKAFSPVIDISSNYRAVGVWINGDNKGEVINFQLNQLSPYFVYDEHYVVVNFSGWKYFELFIRERDADKFKDYSWPYSNCSFMYVYRNPIDNIAFLNIYYNNLPVGQQVSCEIKPVKAINAEAINIANPSITIGSNTITFPVTLQSGQCIEFNSMSDCKHFGITGTFLGYVTPTGSVPTLISGNNTVTFNGTGTSGRRARAEVSMFIDGTQIYP
jgi:hypothetical protein